MINAVPAFIFAIGNHTTYIADEKNYKTEFNVNINLPSPNIYWLLMDGMLGFKAMEHLYNDSQLEFTEQLTERGFIINRNAQFNAFQQTVCCIPALMCPTYYDTCFVPGLLFLNFKKEKNEYYYELRKSANFARVNNELLLAFNKKRYQTSSIVKFQDIYYSTPNVLYLNNQKIIISKDEKNEMKDQEEIEKLKSLFSLLYYTTPLGNISFILDKYINKYTISYLFSNVQTLTSQSSDNANLFFGEFYQGSDKWYLYALIDIMNNSEPKLVIIHDMKAHYPFIYNKKGKKIIQDELDPYNYPSQHYFTSSIVISYIDFILNADPEAIIIIQADHGIHEEKTASQILISKYGKTEEDVRLMQNQTISAVRIPEKWGGLDEPIEPLNITRLLVNRFVGENYKMLASEDIIK